MLVVSPGLIQPPLVAGRVRQAALSEPIIFSLLLISSRTVLPSWKASLLSSRLSLPCQRVQECSAAWRAAPTSLGQAPRVARSPSSATLSLLLPLPISRRHRTVARWPRHRTVASRRLRPRCTRLGSSLRACLSHSRLMVASRMCRTHSAVAHSLLRVVARLPLWVARADLQLTPRATSRLSRTRTARLAVQGRVALLQVGVLLLTVVAVLIRALVLPSVSWRRVPTLA